MTQRSTFRKVTPWKLTADLQQQHWLHVAPTIFTSELYDDLRRYGQCSDSHTCRVVRLISPQHGCWKWEEHFQPNMTVSHFLGLWLSASKMVPRYHSISTPPPFAHGLAFSQYQSSMELIFIAGNLWIHFSPTSYLFLLIYPGGLTMALAGHQCWSFIPLHTGLVLTPLAKFTDLTDCGLNAACLVFSTCPSRFATLAAQFPPILIIHQLVMPVPGRLS